MNSFFFFSGGPAFLLTYLMGLNAMVFYNEFDVISLLGAMLGLLSVANLRLFPWDSTLWQIVYW